MVKQVYFISSVEIWRNVLIFDSGELWNKKIHVAYSNTKFQLNSTLKFDMLFKKVIADFGQKCNVQFTKIPIV